MNPDLQRLQPYPFEKIRALLNGLQPPVDKKLISLAIGEPKHPTPSFIFEAIQQNITGLANYPLTKGDSTLRTAIANWLVQRFQLPAHSINPEQQVIPVNGTREALFSFAQAVIDRTQPHATVVMPNPFYQIYEGAALLAGAKPEFLACTADNGFIPDFANVPAEVWERCQLLYICTPGNPTGAVMSIEQLQQVLQLAEQYDFIVASDECYSELYFDEANPPVGLLQAAAQMGNTDYQRCVVFHSLSKRSNAPGLRSGFVAGDAQVLAQYLQYRTYHGCAMPPPFQAASIAAWQDEEHVKANRAAYQRKFNQVLDILSPVLPVTLPDAGFYLWAGTSIDDQVFTQALYQYAGVQVVPGSYLSREVNGLNPGKNRVRMALVATEQECTEAAWRIRNYLESLN